ncbi:MAG: hypothetical protein ACK52I_28300, partial [Pseudomonadota bacterium]
AFLHFPWVPSLPSKRLIPMNGKKPGERGSDLFPYPRQGNLKKMKNVEIPAKPPKTPNPRTPEKTAHVVDRQLIILHLLTSSRHLNIPYVMF